MVATTAAGQPLGKDLDLRLREKELKQVLDQYRAMPEAQRRPKLVLGQQVTPPKRPVPDPPPGGLILRGYCTYMGRGDDGRFVRSTEYYYKENPDRWAAETQSDLLWLTEAEWRSLIPSQPEQGQRVEVSPAIQRRFYGTIGIDYMEGSVNSLPPRQTSMTLTVTRVDDRQVELRLDGHGQMGVAYDPALRRQPNSRGCEVRLLGRLTYDRRRDAFQRVDIAGIGRAWGNKMNYIDREVRLAEEPWHYGIACELVAGATPMERIPPYNLLHYNSLKTYFDEP